jgi:hypothetical protein
MVAVSHHNQRTSTGFLSLKINDLALNPVPFVTDKLSAPRQVMGTDKLSAERTET